MQEGIRISAVEGNRQRLDGGSMFGNVPRPVWETWLRPDAQHRIELACRALLIETADKTILCETGIGAFFEPKLAERYGVQDASEHRLLTSLAQLGLTPDAITHVILSHLHFDHAGGLLPTYQDILTQGQHLLFRNARYIVGQAAYARACQPHPRDRASFIPGLAKLLADSGRLTLVDHAPPPELAGLVSFVWSDGHTPGQMHTLVHGQQSKLLFCGDLIPGAAWLHLPITMGYDRFPEQVIDEKSHLYQQALAENWWLFYTHDPVFARSRCQRSSDGKISVNDPQRECIRQAL